MFEQCKQCVRISVKALLANKGRSFLTMLGIVIGVGAVIIIMAVGAGAQSLILGQVKTLGANVIGVMPGKAEESGPDSGREQDVCCRGVRRAVGAGSHGYRRRCHRTGVRQTCPDHIPGQRARRDRNVVHSEYACIAQGCSSSRSR